MESVRAYLESSTVHGLVYISSTRRLARLFWILVVMAGFTGAGYMIYQSFDGWAESPVKTTIETLPITEITLPKVTVCPPKNTFTNLNYDLMLLETMTCIMTGKRLNWNFVSYTKKLVWMEANVCIYIFISGTWKLNLDK